MKKLPALQAPTLHLITGIVLLFTLLFSSAGAQTTPPNAKPADYGALITRANGLMKEGKVLDAFTAALEAVKLDESRFEAYLLCATLQHRQGATEQAKEYLRLAVERAPADKKARVQQLADDLLKTPASGQTNAPAESPKLTGEARRKLDGLLLIIEDADKARGDERTKLLREFMEKSAAFLKKSPHQMNLWIVRAALALELNEASSGWEAGRKSMELGAENTEDAKVRKVMALLDRKGWLTDKDPTAGWTNSLGMKFVPIPGTEVSFSAWETRVQDYAVFASATSREVEKPSWTQGPTHPVVKVSWDDAQAFAKWLTEKERRDGTLSAGQSYRLPQDWEWSVAVGLNEARGGTPKVKDRAIKDMYPWGTQWPTPRGAGNYGKSLNVDDYEYTSPVGSFAANRFALYDMGGNVWQWCEDFFDGSSGARVLRGGSWYIDDSDRLLSSFRNHDMAADRNDYGGFRCVLVGVSSR